MSTMMQFVTTDRLISLCSVPERRGHISEGRNTAELSTLPPPPASSEALVNATIRVSPNDEIKPQPIR